MRGLYLDQDGVAVQSISGRYGLGFSIAKVGAMCLALTVVEQTPVILRSK